MIEPSIGARLFVLRRDRDVTGVSGPGDVADGVQWADGTVVLRWRERPSTSVWDSLDLMLSVHGHDGATRVVWADDEARARHELTETILRAYDVPTALLGTEAEREYLHQQIGRALLDAWEARGTVVSHPEEHCATFADAVMPIVGQVLEQRDRAQATAGRAYRLADRWQAAHGSSMFLVRAAGAELREKLDGELEHGCTDDMDDVRQHYAGPKAEPCTKHVGREERQRYGCNGPDPADLREQYAAAIRSACGLEAEGWFVSMLANTVMGVRDGEMKRLRAQTDRLEPAIREQERLADELKREQAASAGLAEQIKKQRGVLDQVSTDREAADRLRAEVQRDRDQHAAVLTDVLSRFTRGPSIGHQCLTTVPDHIFKRWQAVVAPTVERPWWETVAELRAELEQAQAAINRVRAFLAGRWGTVDPDRVRAALDGTEQPTTTEA